MNITSKSNKERAQYCIDALRKAINNKNKQEVLSAYNLADELEIDWLPDEMDFQFEEWSMLVDHANDNIIFT